MIEQWKEKWGWLKKNAKVKGVRCLLTLEQYIQLADEAGITPSQLGRTNESYQMARIGDTGDYEIGNCRFITKLENIREKVANGNSGLGRTKYSHSGIAQGAIKNSKSFEVISPDGQIYSGINLNQFCKDHKLTQVAMAKVCRGMASAHKGWRGKYI